MQINMGKCQVLSIHTKFNLNVSSNYSLNVFFLLSSLAPANDLGAYLTFKYHITTIITKAQTQTFVRGFVSRPMILFVKLSLLAFVPC